MAIQDAVKGREILKSREKFPEFNFLDYDISLSRNLAFYAMEIDDNKRKKNWAISYWKNSGKDVKRISRLSDGFFITSGAIAHMITDRNLPMDSRAVDYLNKKFDELNSITQEIEVESNLVEQTKESKFEDEVRTHIGEFENGVDMFLRGESFDSKGYLIRNNVRPGMTKRISDSFKPLLKELKLADSGKDEQLTEAYSHLKPRQMKKFIDYVSAMISSCEVASAITKAARKPRTRKEKAPTEIVKAVKYQLEDQTSNMKSIHPSKIVNSRETWIYNSKNRRLFKYVALDGMTLTIKGTTIINVDQEKSGGKIIRKPETQLSGTQSLTSRPLNKLFNEIRSTTSRAAGRINEETIIVAAF